MSKYLTCCCCCSRNTPDSVLNPAGECDLGDCVSLAVEVSSSSDAPRHPDTLSLPEPPLNTSSVLQVRSNFVCRLMIYMQQLSFKGPIHPRIRKILFLLTIFVLTSRAVYPWFFNIFFLCELLSFEDIGLLWNIMELQSMTLSLWCSPAMSLPRNCDPVAQAHLWIILSNRVMISGRKHWFLKCIFVPSSSNMFKRRQTALQLISPKLVNWHQKHLNAYTALQVKGNIFGVVVNCPFFSGLQRIVSPETDSGFGSSYLNQSGSGSSQPNLLTERYKSI